MTLICALEVNGQHVLMADTIIASLRENGVPVAIPTLGELPNAPVVNGYYIVETHQKVWCLDNKLAIAWSGRKIDAHIFFNAIRNEFEGRTFTKQSFDSFCATLDCEIFEETDFVGLYRENGETVPFSIGDGVVRVEHDYYGECFVGGDAKGQFIIRLYDDLSKLVEKDKINNGILAATVLLAHASQMMFDEIYDGGNLASLAGGVYEIIFFDGRAFKKLDDILQLFWTVDIDYSLEKAKLFPIAYKTNYVDEYLCVRRLHTQGPEGGEEEQAYGKKSDVTYVINPMCNRNPKRNFTTSDFPSWSASTFINQIVVFQGDKYLASLIDVTYSPSGDGPIKIIEKPGETIFGIRNDKMAGQMEAVKKAFEGRTTKPPFA